MHYADPAMRMSILSHLNLTRSDFLLQEEELAHFAQSTDLGTRGRQLGGDLVNLGKNGRTNARACYKCGKYGHVKTACSKKGGCTANKNQTSFLRSRI